MEKPVCRVCKGRHWGNEAHVWKESGLAGFVRSSPEEREKAAAGLPKKATERQVTKHGVYADKEKRKAYMRELMKRRRSG